MLIVRCFYDTYIVHKIVRLLVHAPFAIGRAKDCAVFRQKAQVGMLFCCLECIFILSAVTKQLPKAHRSRVAS